MFGRGTPVIAAWYSAPNSADPNSARRRMRDPLPTRTYQTALPCRVISRCRCGGRGRGIVPITGLSLTGVRLIIPDHALGSPVLRTLSLCTCCRHYPGAADGRIASLIQPSRISLPRKGCRVGLRIVLFEACSAFTRVTACTLAPSPIRDALSRRLQPLRYLHSCSGCAGAFAGWDLHPLESAAFPRRTPNSDIDHQFWLRCTARLFQRGKLRHR
jgi:hypothetical protein